MTVLVTGAAGFIGMYCCAALLERGERVVGVDNLSPYYSVALKRDRLARLTARNGFSFHEIDIADRDAIDALFKANKNIDRVIHLAAQAGVRHSLEHPGDYVHTNLNGHFTILDACRHHDGLAHLVYASSSSVYGGNTKVPFSIEDRVDNPISLYAATKRADELMSRVYSHTFGLVQTGLRFFTVYGPWGRPDMSAFLFTKAILAGEAIQVFNNGNMRRDFTYIDDIVAGVLAALDRPPTENQDEPPHRIYNLGNNQVVELLDFVAAIEAAVGKKAKIEPAPMPLGDVPVTYADIEASRRDLGFDPQTSIDQGIPNFVAWFREYHGV